MSGAREFEKARQIVGLADFEYALLAARGLEISPVGNHLMRLRLIAANDCNLNYATQYFACWKYKKRKESLADRTDCIQFFYGKCFYFRVPFMSHSLIFSFTNPIFP